ncbi:MAG TPA: DUF1559 domain-containing protein, partial [Planctomycetaceae bacterium]|nr:DUF1559 domain-containing protein [Planctomycetaceae bacterium]
MALALHNYHDAQGLFPYSTLNDCALSSGSAAPNNLLNTNPNIHCLNKRGWVDVLPYMDQGPLHNAADHSQAFGSYNPSGGPASFMSDPFPNGNARIVSTLIPLFICPSDDGDPYYKGCSPTVPHYPISMQACQNGLFGAKTSYDMSVLRYSSSQALWTQHNRLIRRLFGAHSDSRLKDVYDGHSNSVMLVHGTLDVRNGVANTWGYTKWVGNGIDLGAGVTNNAAENPVVDTSPPSASPTLYGPEGINFWWCCPWWTGNQDQVFGRTRNWGAPGSQHAGGCFVALADGSV